MAFGLSAGAALFAGAAGAAVLGGAFSDAPTIPGADPNIGAAAQANAAISKEALDFDKQRYEENKPRQAMIDEYGKKISDAQLSSMDSSTALAKDYADYMKGTFRPVEGAIVDEAMKDTTGEQEQAATDAGAGVDTQFDAQRANTARGMASLGINPNSGKWATVNQQSGDMQAAAKADAMNKARLATKNISWAKKMDAAGLGRNLPSNQATSAGLALTAGNSANANIGTGLAAANASTGVMNQGFNTAINGNNSAGNLYLGQYDAQLKGYAAQQQASATSSAGTGQLVGTLGAAYMKTPAGAAMFASSKKLKTDKQPIEDAEILEEVKTLPVESWKYKEGEGDGGEHIGPYAEDAQKKFGDKVAPDGKAIDVISMMGVNLAATKALAKQVDTLSSQMAKRGVKG